MVELADTKALGAFTERCGGSSPSATTVVNKQLNSNSSS